MSPPRHRPSALLALLDALEADLLAAPAGEVRDALREAGRARAGACQEVRSLLNQAVAVSGGAGGPAFQGTRDAPDARRR